MRSAAVGVAAVCAVATTLLPGPAASAAPPPPDLSILTHNVAMLPTILGGKANGTRADLFAEADHLRGHDVVVLEEAFDNGPADTLKSRLASQYPHQTPVLGRSRSGWDETLGSYSSLSPEDGGVTILSRWPITHRVQYVYADGCGADWFSNKGFVYARLDVDGRPVHVVGTHVQAEDPACFGGGASVRAEQFAELDGFLDGLAIPAEEPIVITGDLNVVKESPEYATMLAALDATAPSFAGHPYSWDPETNPLASSGGREQLDYVLFRRGHQQPRGWTNTTLTPTSPPWSSGGTTYTDYSDHYPVLGGTP
ncbi:sphingomyelin phosphodiesterase [Nocardioides sp. YR527]|uniref:sphingomyelin phosphodiesterase n=1 Tax=Nocardioides sp. YR527 TaxID=1881028 RepID=UPI000888478E|nr:sphingomyelin phosphodiesterase [Nocardioides sp. YR527]SDK24538.1 sphingomyelin phosphodiesterase [Nocardioides sp. YR527]